MKWNGADETGAVRERVGRRVQGPKHQRGDGCEQGVSSRAETPALGSPETETAKNIETTATPARRRAKLLLCRVNPSFPHGFSFATGRLGGRAALGVLSADSLHLRERLRS